MSFTYKNISEINCNLNYLCQNINCPYKHTVSPKKRLIIQDILKKKYILDVKKQICKSPITCFNPNCLYSHYVDYEHRMIINSIIKIKRDCQAESIYFKQFINKSNESYNYNNVKYDNVKNINTKYDNTKYDINPSNPENYMIIPTNIKDIINKEIIKSKLILELQEYQEKIINLTKKLNNTLFQIDQTLFEKKEISVEFDNLKKQYIYLRSIIHQQ